MMKAEPGITHHDSQYDALFLVLGKIIGAQHFSSNADKTGLFAFVLFFLFFSVKCHIQQLEKAVSILNIKKLKNATNILFSLTTLPEKK